MVFGLFFIVSQPAHGDRQVYMHIPLQVSTEGVQGCEYTR